MPFVSSRMQFRTSVSDWFRVGKRCLAADVTISVGHWPGQGLRFRTRFLPAGPCLARSETNTAHPMSGRYRPKGFRTGPALAVLVAALGVVTPAGGQQGVAPQPSTPMHDDVPVVTLEEAIERALIVSPAAVSAEGATSTARAGVLQARSAWLPAVNFNTAYGNSSNQRFDQATGRLVSENYSAQLTGSYDIFAGGRRLMQQRTASATLASAQAREQAVHFQTILTTKQAFYAAAAAAELAEAARQRLARARQQLDFAESRLELGTATRSDVLRADLEVGNAELAVVEAEANLHATRLELGRRIGLGSEVQPSAGSLPVSAPPLGESDAIGAEAESSSPAAVAALADLRARSANLTAAYGAYLPTLRITGGYDWSSFEFPPSDRSWSLRVTASIPLFNNFQRETAVAAARAQEATARATAEDAARQARVAAQVAVRQIETAEHRVRIAARAVELAREDLRVQEERYQLGNATILDLQSSQLSLADAEIAEIQARQRLAIAVGELEAILGRVLDQ